MSGSGSVMPIENREPGVVIETHTSQQLTPHFFKMAHEMVFSRLSLSPREHDMLALFLSRLNKDHWANFLANNTIPSPRYQFNTSVLTEWFGVNSKQLFATLDKPAGRLASRTIGVRDVKKSTFSYTPLFKKIKYDRGTLHIVPNDEIIQAYLGISQGHAKMDHRVFRKLKSEHSKRLYAMLSRFKSPSTKLHPQTIADLHSFFGLLDEQGVLLKKSYSSTKVLIERCIRNSIGEIDKHDPKIKFHLGDGDNPQLGFTTIKSGLRKIVAIDFLFSWAVDEIDERRERQKLACEQNPNEHLVLLYDLVRGLVVNQPGNPTLEELETLENGFGQLIGMRKFIDESFMENFALARKQAEEEGE
jgi:hypothetical protein